MRNVGMLYTVAWPTSKYFRLRQQKIVVF